MQKRRAHKKKEPNIKKELQERLKELDVIRLSDKPKEMNFKVTDPLHPEDSFIDIVLNDLSRDNIPYVCTINSLSGFVTIYRNFTPHKYLDNLDEIKVLGRKDDGK